MLFYYTMLCEKMVSHVLKGRNFSWKREHDTIVCSCTCGQGRMPENKHV